MPGIRKKGVDESRDIDFFTIDLMRSELPEKSNHYLPQKKRKEMLSIQDVFLSDAQTSNYVC
jgi:hypothetical protein